jgi:hypothetical protein
MASIKGMTKRIKAHLHMGYCEVIKVVFLDTDGLGNRSWVRLSHTHTHTHTHTHAHTHTPE